MAYIYKKLVNGRPYYYLRISKRVKGKIVVKDIAYLGNDISKLHSKLDKLPSKYSNEIRKGYRNIKKFIESNHYLDKVKRMKLKKNDYISKGLLEEIESVKLHYNEHFLKLDGMTRDEAFKSFLIDFAYNTTSIEGNTITLKEASRLLMENLTPKDRTVREIFDLQNTEKVFFYLLSDKPKINEKLVIKIHDMLLEGIDNRKGYRTGEIRVFKSKFKASPAKYLKVDMELLFKWYNKNKNIHPFVLVSLFHQKFENIHPFFDGNGRTGRMLMNYMLIDLGYPPFIVKRKNRGDYLDFMSEADGKGIDNVDFKYFGNLVEYLGEEFVECYWNNFTL